jgi:uncharacterized membrane protein YbhN (UPF0104 family)
MQDSLGQLRAAVGAFGAHLGDTHLLPLAIALVLHLASLMVRASVWRAILAAAFPDRRVGVRSATCSYLAGIGGNVVAPFRGGDVVRIVAIRRELKDVSVTTIVSTLIAETAFGTVIVTALVATTIGLGWLPPIMRLPDMQGFEFSFYVRHIVFVALVLAALALAAFVGAEWAMHHVRGFCQRVAAGLRILRSPGRFARAVAAPQLVDWTLRVGVAYALLAAFGIPTAVRYAILAVVIDSLSTALPFTPGGVGAQQGLLAFALSGVASSSRILAYSIGAQAVILTYNVLLGMVALFVLVGHVRFHALHREARAPG